jgi:hypothetical protein
VEVNAAEKTLNGRNCLFNESNDTLTTDFEWLE